MTDLWGAQATAPLVRGGRRLAIPTVALFTLGCKVNQAETEDLAVAFARAGCRRVDFPAPADIYVLNTCTVTHVADRKSRALLRQARRLSPEAMVVATGCYAQVAPEAVAALGVDLVVGNTDKHRLVELTLAGRSFACGESLLVERPRTRAFLKVQDGCDNHCTYCIVPRARGAQRSEPLASVLTRARQHEAEGCRELVLTGVHVGAYGRDCPAVGQERPDLALLLRRLLDETGLERIRLSSIEPEDLTDDLLALWPRSGGRLCRHFHLPLQSGSDAVLRRMGRRYRAADFASRVSSVRAAAPGAAITGDVMAGFPGETADQHEESLAFIQAIGFAGLHVFKYSPRPGTPAARYPGQVAPSLAKRRSEDLQAAGAESAARFQGALAGESLPVLFEESSGGYWTGLTDNYVRVYLPSREDLHNRLLVVRLVAPYGEGLLASPA